jgi:hypothetical protein
MERPTPDRASLFLSRASLPDQESGAPSDPYIILAMGRSFPYWYDCDLDDFNPV